MFLFVKSDNPKSRGIQAAPLFPQKRLFCCPDGPAAQVSKALGRRGASGSRRFGPAQMTGIQGWLKGSLLP